MSASSVSSSPALRVVSGVPKGQHERLYEGNINLVHKLVSGYSFLTGEARDEAFAAGLLGLWKAAQRYDKSRGYAFSTYAGDYVKGHILHYLKRDRQARRIPTVSLETPIGDQESELADVIADPQAEKPGAALVSEAGFDALLKRLPLPQQTVLRAVYEGERPLHSVAADMGVSKQRAGQIHLQALAALRTRQTRGGEENMKGTLCRQVT